MSADLDLLRLPLNESFMPSDAIKSLPHGEYLQTTGQQDSPQYSKEIVKGFVIVLPMVVALILAPMLLSYSRRRRLNSRISQLRCCCRRKITQNNREDHHVIIEISEENLHADDLSMKEIVEKFPSKPTLKKSKMFVETAGITSDPNETQLEEVEDVETAQGRCFPDISLVQFGAKALGRRRLDEAQSTTHSRLTVFENNAYEDTIPSLVESSVDVSHASSPVTRVRDVNFRQLRHKGFLPNMEMNTTNVRSPAFQLAPFPCTSNSISPHDRHPAITGARLSQNRIRRHFSNKECWQPLYAKPKDPETVSMYGYEFANDVIHGHVPPSPLLPAPCQLNMSKAIFEPQSTRDNVNEYAVSRPVEVKASSVSPQIYSPRVGAASQKLSTVSTRRTKRKMKKSRRYRNQLRQKWQRRLPVFNTRFQFGTLDSYGSANNHKISGYIGNRSHGNPVAEDDFVGALMRPRIQMSETTLLEEIWQHVKMLVERTDQEQDPHDVNVGLSKQHSEDSSAHTVVPSTNDQVDSPYQNDSSTPDDSSSGISVQMYPTKKEIE